MKTLPYYVRDKLLKLGADEVIVSESSQEASQVKFVNNKIAKTGTEILIGLSIFLTKNKKIASTTIRDPSKKTADETIKDLIKFIKYAKPKEDYYGIAKGPFKYKEIKELYDKNISNVDEVDYVKNAIDTSSEIGAKRNSGVLAISKSKDLLLSSNGVEAEEKATGLYFSIRAFLNKDASGHFTSGSRTIKNFKPARYAQEAAKIAKLALNPKEGKPGKYDVIFSPLAFGNLLANVGYSLPIFSVESGMSFFANKLNKVVASKNVTLFDDGRLPNGLASSKYDAEGVPTQKNVVIDKGILKTYLHNSSSAKKYNAKNTASAGLISQQPSNIVLKCGDFSKEELFKEVKNGLYITNLWYTRFQNYETGDFSTIPRDGIFLIKNGEIKEPVKNIRVSENMLNILKNVSAIGKKPEQVIGWEVEIPTITPHVLVKNINVTKPIK